MADPKTAPKRVGPTWAQKEGDKITITARDGSKAEVNEDTGNAVIRAIADTTRKKDEQIEPASLRVDQTARQVNVITWPNGQRVEVAFQ